jgi:hypothetical protein
MVELLVFCGPIKYVGYYGENHVQPICELTSEARGGGYGSNVTPGPDRRWRFGEFGGFGGLAV